MGGDFLKNLASKGWRLTIIEGRGVKGIVLYIYII